MIKASDDGWGHRFVELLASFPGIDGDTVPWLAGISDDDFRILAQALQPDIVISVFSAAAMKCIDIGPLDLAERLIVCLETELAADLRGQQLARVRYLRGELAAKRNDWADASERFEEAAELIGDIAMKQKALANAAQARFFSGSLARAQTLYERTLSFAETEGSSQGTIHACLGLSKVALGLSDPTQAIAWLERAEKADKDTLSGVELGQIAMEMGIAFATAGRADRADHWYTEAEKRLHAGPADTREPRLARRLLTALETNRAALSVRRGSPISVADGVGTDLEASPVEQVGDLLIKSAQLFASGQIDPALTAALDALEAAVSADYREGRFDSKLAVGSLLMLQGFYEPALRFASSAVRDLESLRGSAGSEFNKIGYVERRAGAYDVVIDLCRIRAELGWDSIFLNEAFGFAERAKSRAFAEQLGSRTDIPHPAAVPAALIEREAQLLAELSELNSRSGRARGAAMVLETSHMIEMRTEELNEVWTLIHPYAPEYVDLRRGIPVTFEECRDMLLGPAVSEEVKTMHNSPNYGRSGGNGYQRDSEDRRP